MIKFIVGVLLLSSLGVAQIVNQPSTGGSGSGYVVPSTGSGSPSASCPAPSSTSLQLYVDTTAHFLWGCLASGTGGAPSTASGWQKIASTTGIGPFSLGGTAAPLTSDIAASRGACSANAYYLATDTGALSYCDGTNWNGPINPSGQTCIMNSTADQYQCYDSTGALTSVQGTVYRYRVCDIPVGDESSSSAIANAQLGPQSRLCFISGAATIVELDVNADGGTPNVIVGRNHAGTIANIVTGALATAASGGIACSNTGGTTGINGVTTCSGTLQNTSLAAGDYLELVSGTPGGTAKLMGIHIVYLVTVAGN